MIKLDIYPFHFKSAVRASAKAPAIKRSEWGSYYNMNPILSDLIPGLWRRPHRIFEVEGVYTDRS
jgi:hypothetical protein